MENGINKQQSKLTLIAGLLTLANIGNIAFIIYNFYKNNFGPRTVGACVLLFVLTITSVVVGVEARKKERNGLVYPFLVIDSCIICAMSIVTIVGVLLTFGGRETNNDKQQKVNNEATIEYVRKQINGTTIRLYSEQEDEDDFKYRDYDKKVVNEFMSLEFTQDFSYLDQKDCEIEFFKESDHSAYFNKDYTILTIHAENGGFLYGHFTADNRYKLSESDASDFKELIENEISKQRAACLTAKEEAKQYLTFSNFIYSFTQESDVTLSVGFSEEKKDEDKTVLSCLKGIYESGIEKCDDVGRYMNYDLRYEIKNPSLCFLVDEKKNYICLRVIYGCYEDNYRIDEYYSLSDEQTNHLMTVARSLFPEEETA